MTVLKREILLRALENTYGKKGMAKEDVSELCNFLLSFFGYEDYVLDNVLSPPERDIFYNLEEYGFLMTSREEVTISKGKTWRINQWAYIRSNILKMSSETKVEEQPYSIYDEVFKDLETLNND